MSRVEFICFQGFFNSSSRYMFQFCKFQLQDGYTTTDSDNVRLSIHVALGARSQSVVNLCRFQLQDIYIYIAPQQYIPSICVGFHCNIYCPTQQYIQPLTMSDFCFNTSCTECKIPICQFVWVSTARHILPHNNIYPQFV